jgi:hypothetical protein
MGMEKNLEDCRGFGAAFGIGLGVTVLLAFGVAVIDGCGVMDVTLSQEQLAFLVYPLMCFGAWVWMERKADQRPTFLPRDPENRRQWLSQLANEAWKKSKVLAIERIGSVAVLLYMVGHPVVYMAARLWVGRVPEWTPGGWIIAHALAAVGIWLALWRVDVGRFRRAESEEEKWTAIASNPMPPGDVEGRP